MESLSPSIHARPFLGDGGAAGMYYIFDPLRLKDLVIRKDERNEVVVVGMASNDRSPLVQIDEQMKQDAETEIKRMRNVERILCIRFVGEGVDPGIPVLFITEPNHLKGVVVVKSEDNEIHVLGIAESEKSHLQQINEDEKVRMKGVIDEIRKEAA